MFFFYRSISQNPVFHPAFSAVPCKACTSASTLKRRSAALFLHQAIPEKPQSQLCAASTPHSMNKPFLDYKTDSNRVTCGGHISSAHPLETAARKALGSMWIFPCLSLKPVFDYPVLLSPRFLKRNYQPLLHQLINYWLMLDVVQAALAQELAMVELAVIGKLQYDTFLI